MPVHVVRRSARAVLVDGSDLLLIKRTRPGEKPYWVTIGGGIEPQDASLEDALRREVLEEIGARIRNVAQVLVIGDVVEGGIAIQHVFLAELDAGELAAPTGPEFAEPSRGGYELVRVPFTEDGIRGIDLRPTALAEFLRATNDVLLASLGYPVMSLATTKSGGDDDADRVSEPERT